MEQGTLALHTIDYVLLAILLAGLIRGAFRGLSGELSSVIGLVVTVAVAWHLYQPAGEYLYETTQMTPIQADTMALVVIIVGGLILFFLLALLLKHVMELTFKGPLEPVGGALVGFVRYAAITAALLLLVVQFAPETARDKLESESVLAGWTLDRLIPWYEDMIERYPDFPSLPFSEGIYTLSDKDE